MHYIGLIIDIGLIIFGYLLGIGTMALFASSGREDAVSEAYYAGYEMGRKAERERINEKLDEYIENIGGVLK